MTSEQREGLLDLFLKCKLASEVWKDQSVAIRDQGSKELSEAKELADDLMEMGVPEHRIVNVLSTYLPASLYKRHFPAVANA